MRDSEALWNALPSASNASDADRAAIADPTMASHAEEQIGALLVQMLRYNPGNLVHHSRQLLVKCGNDYEGLRKLIVAKCQDASFMGWLWVEGNVYSLRSVLAANYRKEKEQEKRRVFEDSTEGRKARYPSYPAIEY